MFAGVVDGDLLLRVSIHMDFLVLAGNNANVAL